MDIWMKIAAWTLLVFIIYSGWILLMFGLGSGEISGGQPSGLLLLLVALFSFLSTPVSTIWIIGILIIICREIVKMEKESKKNKVQ
jgi:hypothetical protein